MGAAAWLVGTGSILAPSGYWALLLHASFFRHMSLSMHSPSILIPRSGVTPGEGPGYPLQYFCLGNPMDRGAWRATVHGVTKSQARLSTWCCLFSCRSLGAALLALMDLVSRLWVPLIASGGLLCSTCFSPWVTNGGCCKSYFTPFLPTKDHWLLVSWKSSFPTLCPLFIVSRERAYSVPVVDSALDRSRGEHLCPHGGEDVSFRRSTGPPVCPPGPARQLLDNPALWTSGHWDTTALCVSILEANFFLFCES